MSYILPAPVKQPAVAVPRHPGPSYGGGMTDSVRQWEYATIPLIIHNTKAILDQWGEDGWELVTVLPGPDGNAPVAYLKRPKA